MPYGDDDDDDDDDTENRIEWRKTVHCSLVRGQPSQRELLPCKTRPKYNKMIIAACRF